MSNSDYLLSLVRLWGHVEPRRRNQYKVLFFFMVIASFAEVVSIGAVIPFIGALASPELIFDHPMAQTFIQILNLKEPSELLLPLTIVFVLCAVLSGFIRLGLLWLQTRIVFATGADLGFSIYNKTLYQPYAVHAARNSSEVISGISIKVNTVVGETMLPLTSLVSSILILIAILSVLLVIDPVVASLSFIGFGLFYAAVMLLSKRSLSRHSQRINDELTRVIKVLQEGLGGIRDVLIDGTQDTYSKYFKEADIPLRRAQGSVHVIKFGPRYIIEALGILLISVLAYLLTTQKTGFASALPILGAMALGAQRLLPTIQMIYSCWAAMRASEVVSNEVIDLLDQPLPKFPYISKEHNLPFEQDITLKNLTFRYEENSPWIFQEEVNLTIPKGSRVGFIGATGSGKSTLLDIIMALLQPTSGSLAIDGTTITDKNFRSWQDHLSHVPQFIFLTDSTIAENIAFGIPFKDIDHDLVHKAAQEAQIAETIESWSDQYNTIVGERGTRLSGGQRQRLGIARALYKQNSVIVLDEATSALDNTTEQSVMNSIEKANDEVTLIIVAHRLTTLKNCTHIVELEEGKIKQIGSYADIVESSL